MPYMYVEREKNIILDLMSTFMDFIVKYVEFWSRFYNFVLLSLTSVLFRCTHTRTFTQKNQMKSYYINRLLIWPGVLVYRWQTQKQMIVANLFFICDRSKSTLYLHCKQWTEQKKKRVRRAFVSWYFWHFRRFRHLFCHTIIWFMMQQ